MSWWNPSDWAQQSLQSIMAHTVVPIVLWLMALGVLLLAPMRLRWKIIIAVILALVGAVLWGLIQIPGVSF